MKGGSKSAPLAPNFQKSYKGGSNKEFALPKFEKSGMPPPPTCMSVLEEGGVGSNFKIVTRRGSFSYKRGV